MFGSFTASHLASPARLASSDQASQLLWGRLLLLSTLASPHTSDRCSGGGALSSGDEG